jgi:HNH endonuclease
MATIHSTEFATRFWAKVQKTDSCWLWTGFVNSQSRYGKIQIGPRKSRVMAWVHRISWELTNGPIPDGIEVCHNCPGGDNPRCVNPSHLFLGTHADNMRDAARKGQMAKGERRPTSKLTDATVRLIRMRYAAGGITQQALADEHGVSISQICGVVNRATWKHVQ